MGSASSKISSNAAAAARKYPTRAQTPQTLSRAPLNHQPPSTSQSPKVGPTVHPRPQASSSRSEAVNLDASDPDFAQSLRSIGPVAPNPTLSNSSVFPSRKDSGIVSPGSGARRSPAVAVLEARARLQEAADLEAIQAGSRGHSGRQFLDVYTIREMLVLRDERGQNARQIEKTLGLREGAVDKLGPAGVVSLAQEVGRAQRRIEMV